MDAHYDHAHRYLTIELRSPKEAADTVDVAGGTSVVISEDGTPLVIEIAAPAAEALEGHLQVVARRWPGLPVDDVVAAARAAIAAPDRDVRVGERTAA